MFSISFVQVIVFVSFSYVPPAKLHLPSSISVPSGRVAVISIFAFHM